MTRYVCLSFFFAVLSRFNCHFKLFYISTFCLFVLTSVRDLLVLALFLISRGFATQQLPECLEEGGGRGDLRPYPAIRDDAATPS